MLITRSRSLTAAFLLFATIGLQAAESLESLIKSGQYQEAYRVASGQLQQREGEPRFDLLFGLAAVETGHYEQAIFALERVLIAHPEYHRARLELARSYYQTGNFEGAEQQFRTVLADDPPERVQANANRFLERIEKLKAARTTLFSGKAELLVGHDTNINAATTLSTIDIPALGVLILDPSSQATSDQYRELMLGGELQHAIDKRRGLFASAQLRDRNNLGSDSLDTRTLALTGGYRMAIGSDLVRLSLQEQLLYLDGKRYRRMEVASADWTHPLSSRDTLGLFGQLGLIRYIDQSDRNATLQSLGGIWTRQLGWRSASLSISGYVGRERAHASAGRHNGRTYPGLRAGLQWQPASGQSAYLLATHQAVEHHANDPVFAVKRDDRLSQLVLGWDLKLHEQIKLKAKLDLTRNDSNIGLYDYERRQFSLALQGQF